MDDDDRGRAIATACGTTRRFGAVLRIGVCLGASLFPLLASGCWTGRYLARQATGELGLLQARRRIAEVLADPATPAETRRRLALATEARNFGVRVLGLHGGDAYTRFLDTGEAPVAWDVTAAEKDRLVPHLHRFPITGAVPYLGFFREADARAEKASLEARGLDTAIRPIAGFSSVGFFSDPVYSSMLAGSDARTVEIVLHEMLHGTLYLAGHTDWNESLATFVGVQGAALFFAQRGGPASAQAVYEEARAAAEADARFSEFLAEVVSELEALYASPRSREDKLRLREDVFETARLRFIERFVPRSAERPGEAARASPESRSTASSTAKPETSSSDGKSPRPPKRKLGAFATGPINNALVLSYSAYHRSAPDHARIYALLGGDLPALIDLYRRAVERERDPVAYLAAWR